MLNGEQLQDLPLVLATGSRLSHLDNISEHCLKTDMVPLLSASMAEQPAMKHVDHRAVGELPNSRMIMRQSFFFGNYNGVGPEEREYIADTIIGFLDNTSTC